MATQEQFENALAEWEVNGDSRPMVELLQPFGDFALLDIEVSDQKGSDCGAIEIQGRWIAPDEDVDSGDAGMLLLNWLRSAYGDIEISVKGEETTLACFKKIPESWDGPTITANNLPMALLNAVAVTEWGGASLPTPDEVEG